jgi:hypothetical protein
LVQGPPGTGKSHTGKRVLVTAETGRALQVLKEKLPEEIRTLPFRASLHASLPGVLAPTTSE